METPAQTKKERDRAFLLQKHSIPKDFKAGISWKGAFASQRKRQDEGRPFISHSLNPVFYASRRDPDMQGPREQAMASSEVSKDKER